VLPHGVLGARSAQPSVRDRLGFNFHNQRAVTALVLLSHDIQPASLSYPFVVIALDVYSVEHHQLAPKIPRCQIPHDDLCCWHRPRRETRSFDSATLGLNWEASYRRALLRLETVARTRLGIDPLEVLGNDAEPLAWTSVGGRAFAMHAHSGHESMV